MKKPRRISTPPETALAVEEPPRNSRYGTADSEDPIRLYLYQIGRYPLLKRSEEIALARTVELSRKKFRRVLLECDFALRNALELLQQVHAGEVPFDRALQVAVSDGLEKHQIQGRMPHHLVTLKALIELNSDDYQSFCPYKQRETKTIFMATTDQPSTSLRSIDRRTRHPY